MGPRWKGKGFEAKALDDPMSAIVSRLQSSMKDSNAHGLISGSSVILALSSECGNLLNSASFGRPMATVDKEKQWFQLGMEEAFYFHHILNCLEISNGDKQLVTDHDLWQYMTKRKSIFPESFMAYSHLRTKNWVVRCGSQYGVDFVAYRHHPSLVHSEYAVLVLRKGDDESHQRLRSWSEVHCAVRLSGSVAKTLLALFIDKCGYGETSPSFLNGYHVEERIVARWSPEQCREDHTVPQSGS
ncbi:hypothetical protein SAY86_026505 [Trapa natans]|uniref:tRNA-intron lyase n=1 Tax=Trapa natans TaxID=22666 RepID=A0AAN7KLQ3_TRANT|nr:hypothetical protein SAY86_026505 [Trapa natans]